MTSSVISTLRADLSQLGVRAGDFLIVHSSYKSLGLHDKSPADVVFTLTQTVGSNGTLMMPTYTYSYSGVWNVAPFDPATSPGIENGVLTEELRNFPDTLRSEHPTYSVAAWGKCARIVTSNKQRASAMGP